MSEPVEVPVPAPQNGIEESTAHTFAPMTAKRTEHDANVIDLHLSFGAVAQISATPDNAGFLIRVWPCNGTHEYGGNNMTVLTAVVTYDQACKAHVERIDMDAHYG